MLYPSIQESEVLLRTLDTCTDAYNLCCSVGWEQKTANTIKLHQQLYSQLRETLPAQFACVVQYLAKESLKSAFTRIRHGYKASCPKSKRIAIRFDKNSYTFWKDRKMVSLLTCSGRLRFPVQYDRQIEKYLDWKYTGATLQFKRNKFFLRISFEKDIEDIPRSGKCVGIDRGLRKIAVTSTNKFYHGGHIRKICQRYDKIRNALKSAGTKSAKRHLGRLRGKEQRFKADANHCISKQIIADLDQGDTIILENLTGIRKKRRGKKLNKEINSWGFYQLEQFLTYKGQAKGISIEYVDPRYTSQRCSKCGHTHKRNRKSQGSFECRECGFSLNADLNAARNIVLKHLRAKELSDRAVVNQPIVTQEEPRKSKDLRGAATSSGASPLSN